mmetsp:Transcript_53051/g.129582  ORF Transcript_53051/g.129582 Transcript_53051/m.129582 type:complete len:307 (+) Transcript_53051:2-922(+)
MKRVLFALPAASRKSATPPYSTPLMSSLSWTPRASIDMVHATMRTPPSCASFISPFRLGRFFIPICIFIAIGPSPCIWRLDSGRESGPLGSIEVSMRSMIDLEGCFMLTPSCAIGQLSGPWHRSALSPQKVKNIVTLPPIATAPFASTNAAITLSISPLNTTRARLLPPASATAEGAGAATPVATGFMSCPVMRPSALLTEITSSLLTRQKDLKSLKNPGSEALTVSVWPDASVGRALRIAIMGPGHASPHRSSTWCSSVRFTVGVGAGWAALLISGFFDGCASGSSSTVGILLRSIVSPPARQDT